ncbi:MAG: ATP-binding cassette domain-containing protein [Clostridia bacterium]|nr:ATP-binding cassette domain-containing protein [Clostridia bacterium]
MLELKNICFKRDNKQILDHISFTIDDNKLIVITGPNGGGKSTLAKIIMGIEKPDSGEIILNGENITNLSITDRAKNGIGFAFQQPVKFKGITVYDLISLSLGKKIKFSEACNYLSAVGLCPRDYMNREVNASLSGGELKRIELATVVARKSSLTIFDEPEAGIDLWSFSSLIDVFTNMKKEISGSIVIISHQERILNIADKIILISNGKIKESGSKEEILPRLLNNTKSCKFLKEDNNG